MAALQAVLCPGGCSLLVIPVMQESRAETTLFFREKIQLCQPL